jgi:hypothetical protein
VKVVSSSQRSERRTKAATAVAIAVVGAAFVVALTLPSNYGGCRPGWHRWIWHEQDSSPPSFYCGLPPPQDDWGYFPPSLLLVKVAVVVAGVLVARAAVTSARGRRGVAGVEVVAAVIIIGLATAVSFHDTVEERTGQVASTLRCLDAGCSGMTVEQAVMSEPAGPRRRYPLAHRAWREIWNGLYDGGMSPEAIRASLARVYGPEILL